MLYKIALNTKDDTLPPWRVITPDGKAQYFKKVTFRCEPYTLAEKDTASGYRGWIMAEGILVIDGVAGEATIR